MRSLEGIRNRTKYFKKKKKKREKKEKEVLFKRCLTEEWIDEQRVFPSPEGMLIKFIY